MKNFGTAIILAGGKSTRMGFDKAHMQICGEPIVQRIIRQLRVVFDDIIVVTNNPHKFAGLDVKVTEDILKNSGPLGGIHVGLTLSTSKYAFLTACDMPIISPAYAKYMTGIAEEYMPHAVISRKGNWIEPFHALYSRDLTEDIRINVEKGMYKIFDVLRNKNVIKINEDKVRQYSPGLEIFTNLNHMEDLQEYLDRVEAGGLENVLL